jgi:hypothetical protein
MSLGLVYKFTENGPLSFIEYTFSEHDEYSLHLKEFAALHDILIQSALYYEEKEIMEAEWVLVEVGEFQYPQPDDYIGHI